MIYHQTDQSILYQGDCLDIMRTLPKWTQAACIKQGRRYLGVELFEEYCAIAAQRIDSQMEQLEIGEVMG